jgi:hypothetical protein
MMRHLIGAAAIAVFALAGASGAQSTQDGDLVVVELFTSQGCSSCPPADALLAELAAREDILALSLHVDYWDYIGWKDAFAQPAFTVRQKGYAAAGGHRMIYTPQMIIAGQTDVIGHKTMKVVDAIRAHQGHPSPVRLEIERTDDRFTVTVSPRGAGVKPARVQLVRYAPARKTEVTRGENAGHTLAHANVVQQFKTVAEWSGKDAQSVALQIDGSDLAAIIVQEAPYGPVLAAARLR